MSYSLINPVIVSQEEEIPETPLISDTNVENLSEDLSIWQGIGQCYDEDGKQVMPVDQAQTIATAKKLQDASSELEPGQEDIVLIDAGIFSSLNADNKQEVKERIERSRKGNKDKREYLESLADGADVDISVRSAEDYWEDGDFWSYIDQWVQESHPDWWSEHPDPESDEYVQEDMIWLDMQTRDYRSYSDLGAVELTEALDENEDIDITKEEMEKVEELNEAYNEHLDRDLKASQLYFLAEIGLGHYLSEKEDIDVKLGQRSERKYDRHGEPDHIHMVQPRALNYSERTDETVDPYIDEGMRIYASDSLEEVEQKIRDAATDHTTTQTEDDEAMSGIVGLTSYAVEIADKPLEIKGVQLETAEDVMKYAGETADENLPEPYQKGHPGHLANGNSEKVAEYIHQNLTMSSDY